MQNEIKWNKTNKQRINSLSMLNTRERKWKNQSTFSLSLSLSLLIYPNKERQKDRQKIRSNQRGDFLGNEKKSMNFRARDHPCDRWTREPSREATTTGEEASLSTSNLIPNSRAKSASIYTIRHSINNKNNKIFFFSFIK